MNVSKIHDYISNAVGITLLTMVILTGSPSYFYSKFKKAILQRVLNQEVLATELLLDLGEGTPFSETSEEKLE